MSDTGDGGKAERSFFRFLKSLAAQVHRRRLFVGQVGALAVAKYFAIGMGVLQGILVARWLGVQQYGTVALLLGYPAVLFALIDVGSERASIRYLAEFAAAAKNESALAMCRLSYLADLGSVLLAFLVSAVTAPMASEAVLHNHATWTLLLLASASYVPRCLTEPSRGILSSLGLFTWAAWAEAVTAVFRTGMILSLVASGFEVAGVIWGHVLGSAFGGALMGVLSHRAANAAWKGSWWSAPLAVLAERRADIFRFWRYSSLHSAISMVTKGLDLVLVGALASPVEAGYYRLGRSVAEFPLAVTGALSSVSYSRLAALWGEGNWAGFWRFVLRITLGVALPISCLMALLIPFSETLVFLLVGPSYRGSVAICQLMLASTALTQLTFCVPLLNSLWAHLRFPLLHKVAFAILRSAGYLYFIPRFAGIGAAMVLLGTSAVATVVVILWIALLARPRAREDLQKRKADADRGLPGGSSCEDR